MKFPVFLVVFVAVFEHVRSSENLSFQRPALMSEPLIIDNPEIVVDGITSQDEESCIRTADNSDEAWWQVRLQRRSVIDRVEIYYRESDTSFTQMKRLAGFSVYVANGTRIQAGTRCYHHDGTDYPDLYMDIPCVAVGQVITIHVQRPPEETYATNFCYSESAILELCEVEIFGCEIGFYGRDCTRTCPSGCVDNQCDPQTGDCLFGCQENLTGSKCNEDCLGPSCREYCPNNCANNICNFVKICTDGCEDGWTGDQCETPCESGFFGAECKERCFCDHGSCNNQNGSCPDNMCVEGWMPPSCSQLALQQASSENMTNTSPLYIAIVCLSLVVAVLFTAVAKLVKGEKFKKTLVSLEGLSRKQQPAPKQKTEQNEAEYVDPDLVVNKNRTQNHPHKYSELAKPGNTYYLDPVNSKDNNSMKSTAMMNQYELEEEEDYYSLAK